jgi:hypothetical protein
VQTVPQANPVDIEKIVRAVVEEVLNAR